MATKQKLAAIDRLGPVILLTLFNNESGTPHVDYIDTIHLAQPPYNPTDLSNNETNFIKIKERLKEMERMLVLNPQHVRVYCIFLGQLNTNSKGV